MEENEKRRLTRASLPGVGMIVFEEEGREVEGTIETRDISAAGGYFIAHVCPPMADQVRLCLQWPAEGDEPELTLNTTGVVLRVEELSENKWGFAVKFEGVPNTLAAQ